jgi:hypothetical protein
MTLFMASFLHIFAAVKKPRTCAGWGLLLVGLAACGSELPPRLTDAGPRPARISPRDAGAGTTGAVLAATGRQSFQGSTRCRCVPHAGQGVQLNFRTGNPELPAVAVRIGDFHGAGPYRARLFVTGRSRSGALVTSTGEVNVQLSHRALPAGTAARLGGSFAGVYGGAAGKGSIEGRFDACTCSPQGRAAAGVAAAP